MLIDTLDLEYLSTVCRLTGMSVALMYWDKCVAYGESTACVPACVVYMLTGPSTDGAPRPHDAHNAHTTRTHNTHTQRTTSVRVDRIVEKLLSKLYEINKDAETSGKFDRLYDRSKLVEMVAQVNIISTNMLHRLRVLDKHKYAWRDEDVDSLWGKLAYELDLGQRYDSLTSKVRVCGGG